MKKVGFLSVVLASLWVGGCGTDSTARVEIYRQRLAQLEGLLVQSDARIEALEAALEQGGRLLTDPNLADPNERAAIAARVEQARAALAVVQAHKAELQAWVTQTRQAIERAQAAGGIDLSGELGLIGEALSAGGGAIGGPVGAIVGLLSLLASLAGNVLQKRSNGTLKADNAALGDTTRAIVKGVEKAPTKSATEVKAAIEAAMKSAGVYDVANAVVDTFKG